MKKLRYLFPGLFFLLSSTNLIAQSKPAIDYFKGKWIVVIKGTPNGDAKMIFQLQSSSDSLTGIVQDSTGNEISKIAKVELTDSSANVYFTAQGYDVNVLMIKRDDDHVTGNLMSMFDVEGVRKEEEKN